MSPMTFDQVVALAGLAVAAMGLLGGWLASRSKATQDGQAIRDKLDSIDGTGKDTRADVREINRKLDEDRRQLASVTSRVDSVEQRLSRVEGRCDQCRVGGTD